MEEQFKALIGARSAWLLGIGIATFLAVWWATPTPMKTNMSLVFGVVVLAASVLFSARLAQESPFVRLLWTLFIGAGLGVLVNYTLWVRPAVVASEPPSPSPPSDVAVRVKYQGVQSVQFASPNAEGFRTRNVTVNLSDAGTLHLFAGSLDYALMVMPENIPLKVDEPRPDVQYPGGIRFPDANAGKGLAVGGVAVFEGPQKRYRFTRTQRSHEIVRGNRTFTVTLNDIRDLSKDKSVFIEYTFGIAEK